MMLAVRSPRRGQNLVGQLPQHADFRLTLKGFMDSSQPVVSCPLTSMVMSVLQVKNKQITSSKYFS